MRFREISPAVWSILALLEAGLLEAGLPAQAGSVERAPANPDAKVATHYYYWYKWPDEHFKDNRPGVAGHFNHFKDPKKVDYLDPSWHLSEFRDMAASGIDFALPVYWGAPGAYDRPGISFARAGLPPMVEALQRLEKNQEKSVRLGLFYDTAVLRNDVRGVLPEKGKPDLRTAAGKQLFCGAIVGFFEKIPKRFWARVRGRALVVLYVSGFVSGWDGTLGAAVRKAFARRFEGEQIFLVSDVSWGAIGQDRQTGWLAAIEGPKIFPGVAEIGPGFDNSPCPPPLAPIRPREDGRYYGWSWRQAIASRPELVILETWNEMHEGSEICETKELGRKYIDLTRQWVGRLRSGELGPAIGLKHYEPLLRPDHSWGKDAAGLTKVFADYTKPSPVRVGLREIRRVDGVSSVRQRSLRPRMSPAGNTYLYFQVADSFLFNTDKRIRITVVAEPFHGVELALEYDARDRRGMRYGLFTEAVGQRKGSSGSARRVVFELPRARFANRLNGAADFRFRVQDVRTAIRRIEVTVVR